MVRRRRCVLRERRRRRTGTIREGWDDVAEKLLAIQKPLALAQKRREAIAKSTAHKPEKGLAIVHARLFDPATRAAKDDMTIVIEGNRVKAVGAKLAAPAGFEVIDAKGKTVLPGLWDMHVHLDDDEGLLSLAEGVTTVRDLGNDVDSSLARRARWDAGDEIGPRVILAGLIDGPGPYQGPTGARSWTPRTRRARRSMTTRRRGMRRSRCTAR